jgi:hypothetical protein
MKPTRKSAELLRKPCEECVNKWTRAFVSLLSSVIRLGGCLCYPSAFSASAITRATTVFISPRMRTPAE